MNHNPIKICRICDERYESIDVYDEDTCDECWESVFECIEDDLEETLGQLDD